MCWKLLSGEMRWSLTHGTCCLRPSISCFTQLNTARYTSSSDGTLRLSLEIRSRTWMEKTKLMGRDILYNHLQEQLQIHAHINSAVLIREALAKETLIEKTSWPNVSSYRKWTALSTDGMNSLYLTWLSGCLSSFLLSSLSLDLLYFNRLIFERDEQRFVLPASFQNQN